MQDSNLRGAVAPTTVFETAALPGSANPPYAAPGGRAAAVGGVALVEVPGVEPGPSPYQGAAQTAMLHLGCAEGARIERAPGLARTTD